MEGRRTRILVVERSRLVGEAVWALFEELVEHAEIRLAQSLDDAVAVALRDQPELVVLDAWIGSLDSTASIKRILTASPRSSVIVIATKLDAALATTLVQAGAAGVYERESLPKSVHGIVERLPKSAQGIVATLEGDE